MEKVAYWIQYIFSDEEKIEGIEPSDENIEASSDKESETEKIKQNYHWPEDEYIVEYSLEYGFLRLVILILEFSNDLIKYIVSFL